MNQTNIMTVESSDPAEIRARVEELREAGVQLRARDLAARLGISEGALVASECDGEKVIRLGTDWAGLFTGLTAVGTVMALTRNHSVVHEKDGVYDKVEFSGMHGIVLNHDIDLRFFPRRWRVAYATESAGARGAVMRGIQFFDHYGEAVHKVYCRAASDLVAWEALVNAHRADDQSAGQAFDAAPAPEVALDDSQIDVDGFREAWRGLQDTHDFFLMLRKFRVQRLQAMRLAPPELAREVSVHAAERVLREAAGSQVPIMVFVGNPGTVQIHTGEVHKVVVADGWLNVLDAGFNLHCRMADFATAWVVQKPTVDGIVTSLEVFDAAGELLVTFFGERKPGKAELESWRTLVAAV